MLFLLYCSGFRLYSDRFSLHAFVNAVFLQPKSRPQHRPQMDLSVPFQSRYERSAGTYQAHRLSGYCSSFAYLFPFILIIRFFKPGMIRPIANDFSHNSFDETVRNCYNNTDRLWRASWFEEVLISVESVCLFPFFHRFR